MSANESKILETKNLNFSNMYDDDFLLTWEKSDDEVMATFLWRICRCSLREDNISPACLPADWLFRCSATILPAPASASPARRTCWGWKCRIWMRVNHKLLMVKPYVKNRKT